MRRFLLGVNRVIAVWGLLFSVLLGNVLADTQGLFHVAVLFSNCLLAAVFMPVNRPITAKTIALAANTAGALVMIAGSGLMTGDNSPDLPGLVLAALFLTNAIFLGMDIRAARQGECSPG